MISTLVIAEGADSLVPTISFLISGWVRVLATPLIGWTLLLGCRALNPKSLWSVEDGKYLVIDGETVHEVVPEPGEDKEDARKTVLRSVWQVVNMSLVKIRI